MCPIKFIFSVFGLIFALSCTHDSVDDLILVEDPTEEPMPITYVDDVKVIMDNNCISCHANPPINGASTVLIDFISVKSVFENNALLDRISKPDGEPGLMPLGGPRLPQNLIDIISQWEQDGLLEE